MVRKRWERHGLRANSVRVCAFESGPSQTTHTRASVAGLPLEQSWGISESTVAAAGLAADGPCLRGDGDSEGQRSRAAAIRGSDGKNGVRRNDRSNGNRFGEAGVWGRSNSAKNFWNRCMKGRWRITTVKKSASRQRRR